MPERASMNGHRLPATPDGRLESQLVRQAGAGGGATWAAQVPSSPAVKQNRDELEVLDSSALPDHLCRHLGRGTAGAAAA